MENIGTNNQLDTEGVRDLNIRGNEGVCGCPLKGYAGSVLRPAMAGVD